MQQSSEQLSPQRIGNAPYPQGISAPQSSRALRPIHHNVIQAALSSYFQVSKAKTLAFVITLALVIFGSAWNLRSCEAKTKSNSCMVQFVYLIAVCICGLVYLLMSLAIHFKRPDTIHVGCLSLFLFGNPQSSCCDGCAGVVTAIFIIFIAPIAFVAFLVAVIRHCNYACKKQENREEGNQQIQMNHDL